MITWNGDTSARIKSVDKPYAALLKDLKQRGMLEDTLVIWTGEFGRTPDNNKRGGVYSLGRGHNNQAMTMMLAGGGVKTWRDWAQPMSLAVAQWRMLIQFATFMSPYSTFLVSMTTN